MKKTTYNNFEFELIYECEFSILLYNDELMMVICSAKTEYIPINNFKTIFLKITNLLEFFQTKHLIFDKRNLRTFHQPSMEWYFAIWKPFAKEKGLVNHYKILPELDWFKKAVEAGKHEIIKKYSKEILIGISILYVKNIEEAIDKCKK